VNERMKALGCSGPGALNVLRNKAFEQTGSSSGSKRQLVERLERVVAQQQSSSSSSSSSSMPGEEADTKDDSACRPLL
jgi:hypothetical protein